MKSLISALFLSVTSSFAADMTPASTPEWITVKPVDANQIYTLVEDQVSKDKAMRRGTKDLEFVKNVMTNRYFIPSHEVEQLLPWISKLLGDSMHSMNRYLAVDFSVVASLICVKSTNVTAESAFTDLTDFYKAAKVDRKKRKELSLIEIVVKPYQVQEMGLDFSQLRQNWFEERSGQGAMMPSDKLALMSSRSLIEFSPFMSGTMPSERPIKIEMDAVYDLLSQRFGTDCRSGVAVLQARFKALKTEQRYLYVAMKTLEKLSPTGIDPAWSSGLSQSMAPDQDADIAGVLGLGTYYKSEMKTLLPTFYKEFVGGKTQQILQSLASDQFSTNGRFVIKSQAGVLAVNQSEPASLGDEDALISFKEGKLYRGNQIVSDSTDHHLIYAVDPHGRLCIQVPGSTKTPNHDRFFTVDGRGQPIACGGHISVVNGKITKIDTGSGHYMPAFIQLLFVIKYLNDQGVINPSILIQSYDGTKNISLKEALSLVKAYELHA